MLSNNILKKQTIRKRHLQVLRVDILTLIGGRNKERNAQ